MFRGMTLISYTLQLDRMMRVMVCSAISQNNNIHLGNSKNDAGMLFIAGIFF
jgi:hypothetical protein